MFSFFSKKAAPTPPDAVATDGDVQQLRTPSPSDVASTSKDPSHPQASPTPSLSRPPFFPQTSPAAPSASLPAPETLESLLTSIPPKTLHSYTLAHLADAPPPTLAALSTFFATLTPPPRLHCVRCHQDFIEVENTERSCRVAHDDDSAEVEYVGRSGRGHNGSDYETLWGCCGRTAPGEGDLGPPDGWCYEGKHTTDIKRARFRADSTPQEDKLVSCLKLNCHGIRATLPRATRASNKNKRPRPAEDDDDEGSKGTEDSGIAEIAKGVTDIGKGKPKSKAATKGKGKGKAKATDSGAEDGESSIGRPGSVKSATTPKRRGRPLKRKEAADEATRAGDKSPQETRKTRSTSRKPKSSVHVLMQKRSPSRPRATKESAETGDEKTDGEGDGKARKKRKVAPSA